MTSIMMLNQHKNRKDYVIIASLKSESMGKLINRIPGLRLLISSLSGSVLRTNVELLSKPHDVNKRSGSLACKLDIKRHSPSILYISASLAMSTSVLKALPVNLISKDTHLVFSISRQAWQCQQVFSKPCL